ncbi:MAG: GGDEF domain-containing protein [Myxococcales bacterium]|nr:GGDEF domain-containing protein [Myxococcales bacterium]
MTDVRQQRADDEVEAALDQLQERIAERIRFEQMRDQLTGLPNLAALNAAIGSLLERRVEFWAAFVEIDRFKWINDKFGYGNANALLRKLAELIESLGSCFPCQTTAFRAHGDEFYLLGECSATPDTTAQVGQSLELVREALAALRVQTERGALSCTASIGWVTTTDLLAKGGALVQERTVFDTLEKAVAEAKWESNRVVRYSVELVGREKITVRTRCKNCGSSIVLTTPRDAYGDGPFGCPNCASSLERPPTPADTATPQPERV